jgi:hypothetical protein
MSGNWPAASLAHLIGPAAQQLTDRPPKRPAHRARLGRNWPGSHYSQPDLAHLAHLSIGCHEPSIAADLHRTVVRASRVNKTRLRPAPPCNPRAFFLLPLSHSFSPTQAAAAARWPAAGLRRRRRRSAARPRPPVAPSPLSSAFFSCHSPTSLALHHARSRERHGRPWRPGENWRRRRGSSRRRVRSPRGREHRCRADARRCLFGPNRGPVPRVGERRRSGESSTRPVHPHSVHQGNAGSCGGKVRPW